MTTEELADARRLLDLYENLVWFIEEGYGDSADRGRVTLVSMLVRSSAAALIASERSDD